MRPGEVKLVLNVDESFRYAVKRFALDNKTTIREVVVNAVTELMGKVKRGAPVTALSAPKRARRPG
jgi:hypothetical protein